MRPAAALIGLALLAGPIGDALGAKVSLKAEVQEKTWKAVRLRGLPQNASLAVKVQSSGPLRILLVHESEVKRFPNLVRPAFAASLERTLSFRLTLPLAGTYYVILDNRAGSQAREVRLLLEALPVRRPPPKKAPAERDAPRLDAT